MYREKRTESGLNAGDPYPIFDYPAR